MSQVLIYITCRDRDEAMRIGETLVEERLAACANVHGAVDSFYWWDGKVETGSEVALIAKSRADLVEALTARVKELHGYSVPCVVALALTGGNPDFLRWIDAETRAKVK